MPYGLHTVDLILIRIHTFDFDLSKILCAFQAKSAIFVGIIYS